MKWRIQFILLVTFMACFIIGGIHLAEKGTQQIDGTWGSPQSFHITRAESGSLEMTVFGKNYFLADEGALPVGAQVQNSSAALPQDTKSEKNLLSTAGNTFGGWLSNFAKQIVARLDER